MISTKDLSGLPAVDELRCVCQSIAMLDAILSPDWQYRYYSFNSKWSQGEMMASMRDGCGDDYFILFCESGAIIKGFAHESKMSPYGRADRKPWPGVLDQVPKDFAAFLAEPAFSINDVTFCIWRRVSDSTWKVGKITFPKTTGNPPDGSAELLSILDGNPVTYREWAESYYETAVPLRYVKHIYQHKPLTELLIAGLNPDVSLADLAEDVTEIGFPAP